jgi:hypothetical protein
MRALFGVLLVLAVALTAGVIGFQAGVASNIAAAGGVVWLGGGFPFFGLLLFLMFIGFMFFAIGGARRRAMGQGPRGMGRWGGPGTWSHGADSRHEWVREMHRRLHEDEASSTGSDPSAAGGTGGVTGDAGPAAS